MFLLDLRRNLDPSTLISVDQEWIARLEQVIAMNGEYYSTSTARIGLYSADRAGVARYLLFDIPIIASMKMCVFTVTEFQKRVEKK
jgi:hypothetical protein